MIIILIIAIAAIILGIAREVIGTKRKKQFESHYMPNDAVSYREVSIYDRLSRMNLGIDDDHLVNWMCLNNKKQISFPESKFGNRHYYLIDISFKPNIKTNMTVHGRGGSALVGGLLLGPVGAAIGASRKKKIDTSKEEKVSDAYLTVVSADLQNTFDIDLSDEKTASINGLHNYVLNEIEMGKLRNNIQDAIKHPEKYQDNYDTGKPLRRENVEHDRGEFY